MHAKKVTASCVHKGQYSSVWVKSCNWIYNIAEGLTIQEIRKGMVLLELNSNPFAIKVFEADIWTVDGSKKVIKMKYQPVLYVRNVRQGVRIKKFIESFSRVKKKRKDKEIENEVEVIDTVVVTSQNRTKIVFEFLYHPEYLTEGTNLIINDNLLKAYGVITKLYK
jgi:GTPase